MNRKGNPMISRKQFYGVFLVIILIFIAAVFISNSKAKTVQGDSLEYKNGVLYTQAGEKYTGRVTETEGYKAKINGVQISKGFITVKKGVLNGKFEFISFNEFWNGAEVAGKAKNGIIKEIKIKTSEKTTVLKNKEAEEYFSEKNGGNQNSQAVIMAALGIFEDETED
jgi:hypothetical protein